MMLTRWNPFAKLAAMEQTANHIFSQVFGAPDTSRVTEPTFYRLPLNVEEVDGQYKITAPIPGFNPDEVDVSYLDGALTISARHSEEKKSEGNGYLAQEVVTGSFYRQVCVGEVDPSSITANFENGVLTVTLPAPAKPQPAKIAINTPSGTKALKSGSRKQLTAKTV